MAMNYHHQLQLLVDILQNQQDENYGTHDEYEQVERLANSLIENHTVPEDIKSIAANIQHYAHHHDIPNEHNSVNIQELQKYVHEIQQAEQRPQGDSTFL
ncbi:YtzH-like family protein [Evansella halocellulosilytica]|uniref:YtzH-like family protein n=1 Tax=Evansella halocellulosilytica TaxID=2011013 RepID=UPI000BB858A8|nr:YtzH-like family protein [Evansella halocellulosilytica]